MLPANHFFAELFTDKIIEYVDANLGDGQPFFAYLAIVINGNPGRNPQDHRLRMLNFLRPADGLTWGLRPTEAFEQ